MPATLLLTKLYIPPSRSNIVLRQRLLDRLTEGLSSGRKLVLISAPAGFGKTTLVSEWIGRCGKSVAWLSLDEGDNDLSRFLTYLISALQTIATNIGSGVLSVIKSPQPPPTESLLTELLNEIVTIQDDFILVLDDYHLIDSKPIDATITFLLERMPLQMHLVIATREDPHLPLARLRARDQLIELRAAELRFNSSEATEFLNQVMGLNLSVEDAFILENRAEGWVAGLQLAALSMQGREDVVNFIHAFAGDHRYIVDYLVEEVIQRQPEPVRSFLLQTAILDRLNGSLCDAVTGQAESNSRLEALERGNFFVVPLDDKRDWYRYHHLFADVLRMHLKIEQPDQISTLHRRASEWFEHNGLMDNAIHHALVAEDFARAAGLIELVFPTMNRNRQFTTLLNWLKALPEEVVQLRPVLSTEYALVSMSCGENERVEPWLRNAERWVNAAIDTHIIQESSAGRMVVVDGEEFRRVPGMIALIRAGQALGRGDMPETVKNARRALELAPEDDYLTLGGAASQLGLVAWANGNLDAARQMTAEGLENVRRAGYISAAIGGTIVLADIQITQGCLHEAMTTYEQGLQWATRTGAPLLQGAADMYVGMSNLHYEHNDLKTATQLLFTSQALGELAALPQNPYRWCAAMARIKVVHGDLEGALDLLDQAERLYNSAFSPNVQPIASRKTRVWVSQGRLEKALGWVHEKRLSVENQVSYLSEFDHITFARVLLSCYQRDPADDNISEVLGLLERLLKAAEERRAKGNMIEILVMQALANQILGDLPAALLPLESALRLAEPECYIRLFIDEGSNLMQLLREGGSRGIMPAYISKLLAAFETEKRIIGVKPDLLPAQPLIDPLSQRELRILLLIAQGLANREIGERLFLALDTVKGHNRKIFDKLQVQSRTEAVARARELGLL